MCESSASTLFQNYTIPIHSDCNMKIIYDNDRKPPPFEGQAFDTWNRVKYRNEVFIHLKGDQSGGIADNTILICSLFNNLEFQ